MTSFPEFANLPFPPHEYQREAFLSHAAEMGGQGRSQLIVMATGLGKSVTACLIARDVIENRGGRVLVLAHRKNLIGQLAEEFEYWGLPCSIERAEFKARELAMLGTPSSRCVVGCVATLKGRRLAAWPKDYFGLVVVDECHHATAPTYRNIFDHFDSAKLLGITATPNRTDGTNLGEIFRVKAFEYLLPNAIENGELSRLEMHECDVGIDLRKIREIGRGLDRDFDPEALGDALQPYVEPIAKAAVSKLGPGQTLIFAPCRRSAQAFASAFTELGVPTASVDYKTADVEGIIAAFKEGTMSQHGLYQALSNFNLLGEGFNHRPIGNIVLLRPTQSEQLVEQILGRATRRCEGKVSARIIDFNWIVDADKIARPVDLFCPAGADKATRDAARKAAKDGVDPIQAAKDAVVEAARKAEEERLKREEAERKRLAREDAVHREAERKVQVRLKDKGPIQFRSRQFDLFAVRKASGLPAPVEREGVVRMPASSATTKRLEGLGIPTDGVSQREGEQLIGIWTDRHEAGMSTFKQVRTLVGKLGYSADQAMGMSNTECQSVLGKYFAKMG
jgi:superfamily II DNA or RNA helicase